MNAQTFRPRFRGRISAGRPNVAAEQRDRRNRRRLASGARGCRLACGGLVRGSDAQSPRKTCKGFQCTARGTMSTDVEIFKVITSLSASVMIELYGQATTTFGAR